MSEKPDPYSSEMCQKCIAMYAKLYQDGSIEREFPPICRGDIRLQEGYVSKDMSPQEKSLAVLSSPVNWSKYELNINPRWYQEEILYCSARQKVFRCGRRIGKSVCLILGALHGMSRNKNYRVLMVAPYQSQIDTLFGFVDEFLSSSRTLKNKVKRRVKSPQMLELSNGSVIRGFPSGINSGGKSDKVRGQDAHEIIIDETDYLPDSDLDAIVAILASNKDTKIRASSTPTGRKTKYYGFCQYKNQGWKEFHYSSMVSPEWTAQTEAMLKGMYSEAGWQHEILAEFGTFEEGVFPTEKLESSLQSYKYADCVKKPNCIYSMGVDWNEHPIGVHVVVVEYDPEFGEFKTVDKRISNNKEFTQGQALEDIIKTYRNWMPNWLWADAGAGGYQIESLKKLATMKPELKLRSKIRGVLMHEKEVIKDPITKQDVKKQAKSLMVDLCVRRIETNQCIFPREEDNEDLLVDQLRNFKIERFTPNGLPVFSQGVDHTAVAWMIAMYAILLNRTDIRKVLHCKSVGSIPIYNHNSNGTYAKNNTMSSEILGSRDIKDKGDIRYESFRNVSKNKKPSPVGFVNLHKVRSRKNSIRNRARI